MPDVKTLVISELDSEYQNKLNEIENESLNVQKLKEKLNIEYTIEKNINGIVPRYSEEEYYALIDKYDKSIREYKDQSVIIAKKLNYLRAYKDDF